MFRTYFWLLEGSLTAFPWVPPSLFNGAARVVHSLAMWPQSWHLKHCRGLEPHLLCVPSCTLFCTCWFTLRGDSTLLLLVIEELQMDSSGLAQASPTIVGAWTGRSVPVCLSSPTTPGPWAIGGTSRVTTLLCPSQSSHQLSYLVPQLFWARGHFGRWSWSHFDFCLLCLTLCPLGYASTNSE